MVDKSSQTLDLAKCEMLRYGFQAEFKLEKNLPSFEIRKEKNNIIIAAPSEIEFLYGVYKCAEEFFGWDFFEPGKDVFHPELVRELPEEGILYPAREKRLERCGFIQEFPFDETAEATFDFMAKNQLNYLMVWMSYYDGLSPELKEFAAVRGIIIESGHHNFNYLIPPEKYRKEHPEFFAENEQTRQQRLAGMPEESRQLCTTNAALRKELVKNLLEYREKHPELQYLALNPNDGFGWCECPECSRLYDKDLKGNVYSLSEKYYKADRIFHELIDAVNDGIHEKAPDIILNFFAYINYTSPAPGFRLRPGMGVHLALYWRCINHDIDCEKCGINSGYYQDILAWEKAKAGGLFNIYEYFMGINFYLGMPMLHFEAMFREFDFYNAHKVDGVFTQFWPDHWTSYGPNYCFMAKAARGEDPEKAISDFYQRRFGRMEKTARKFYGKLREILGNMSDCHIPHCIAFLSRVSLAELESLREDAEILAANCPELPGRACGIWVEYMCRFKKIYDDSKLRPTSRKRVEEFLSWIHANKDAKIFVTEKFACFFKDWFEDIDAGRDWHFFTENDWFTEYSRRKVIPR